MVITLLSVGKTDSATLNDLVADFEKRITRFVKFEQDFVLMAKNTGKLPSDKLKLAEAKQIELKCRKADYIILLDEKGRKYSSVSFAAHIEKLMVTGRKNIVFVVGGAYGFADSVYSLANEKISMSDMTTTHQLIRLFFTEQLYRAFTIIHHHPYHNI